MSTTLCRGPVLVRQRRAIHLLNPGSTSAPSRPDQQAAGNQSGSCHATDSVPAVDKLVRVRRMPVQFNDLRAAPDDLASIEPAALDEDGLSRKLLDPFG